MTTPSPRIAEEDEERHAHRWDLTPAMVAMDEQFVERPADFFADLATAYSPAFLAGLWRDAGEELGEQWQPITGYEGCYEVSDLGRVRSLNRVVVESTTGRSRRLRGMVLRPRLDTQGYLVVTLWRNGIQQMAWVSRLVAAAFIGPCPEGLHVAHGDGNPQHNRPTNLRYATRKENEADKRLHGTLHLGEKHALAKLTNEQAVAIVRRYHQGEEGLALAAEFGVIRHHVYDIIAGRRWTEVTAEVRAECARTPRAPRRATRRGFGSACGNGHLLDERNGRLDSEGKVRCRACARERQRRCSASKAAA